MSEQGRLSGGDLPRPALRLLLLLPGLGTLGLLCIRPAYLGLGMLAFVFLAHTFLSAEVGARALVAPYAGKSGMGWNLPKR